jgi:hypothetical protein
MKKILKTLVILLGIIALIQLIGCEKEEEFVKNKHYIYYFFTDYNNNEYLDFDRNVKFYTNYKYFEFNTFDSIFIIRNYNMNDYFFKIESKKLNFTRNVKIKFDVIKKSVTGDNNEKFKIDINGFEYSFNIKNDSIGIFNFNFEFKSDKVQNDYLMIKLYSNLNQFEFKNILINEKNVLIKE